MSHLQPYVEKLGLDHLDPQSTIYPKFHSILDYINGLNLTDILKSLLDFKFSKFMSQAFKIKKAFSGLETIPGLEDSVGKYYDSALNDPFKKDTLQQFAASKGIPIENKGEIILAIISLVRTVILTLFAKKATDDASESQRKKALSFFSEVDVINNDPSEDDDKYSQVLQAFGDAEELIGLSYAHNDYGPLIQAVNDAKDSLSFLSSIANYKLPFQ